MSKLSTWTLLVIAFSPLALTLVWIACIGWVRNRAEFPKDIPQRLLGVAAHLMAGAHREWGAAMVAELDHVQDRFARWQFALGCIKVALFPPGVTSWPLHWLDAFRQLGPKCGALGVALPPLGLPLLVLAGCIAENYTSHDHFFNGELVPALVGTFIICSFACILAGVPLGLAGIVKGERARWLSLTGPCLSLAILSYTMFVQHFATANR